MTTLIKNNISNQTKKQEAKKTNNNKTLFHNTKTQKPNTTITQNSST